jgi:hypothetical protein
MVFLKITHLWPENLRYNVLTFFDRKNLLRRCQVVSLLLSADTDTADMAKQRVTAARSESSLADIDLFAMFLSFLFCQHPNSDFQGV